jgi:hypothetical protein
VQCRIVYCLVGINEKDIQEVARSAVQSLEALKAADPADRARLLGQSGEVVQSERLPKFTVEGYCLPTVNEVKLDAVWPIM